MTNEQLAVCIQSGEVDRMGELYSQIERFIHGIAWKYRAAAELEDLKQEGFLALYDAVRGYEPETGNSFLGYAAYWIEARIRRFIQKNSSLRIPSGRQEKAGKLTRFREEFEKENGRKPTEWETCCFLHISPEEYREREKSAFLGHCMSLDAPITDREGEGLTLADTVAASGNLEEDTVERMHAQDLKETLWNLVDSLEGKQPEIIRARYQDGKTLREIAEAQGIQVEAVRQQQAKGLRTLRNPKNANRLRILWEDDRIYQMALKGNGAKRFRETWTSSTERTVLSLLEGKEGEECQRLEWR